jgi:hypothetical protein
MNEEEVVQLLHQYFESLFPKFCSSCRRRFSTLLEYIQVTKRIGNAVSYDANDRDWNPKQPIGSVVMANCPCGSTIALTTEDMELPIRLELLNWVRKETQRRSLEPSELLEHLRDTIRRRVLAGAIQSDI